MAEQVDPRVLEGRKLMLEDEQTLGPVSEEAKAEVQAAWPQEPKGGSDEV